MPESPHSQNGGEDPLDVRFGEILNDFLDRRACGEAVSEADLFARHAEFADELREALELMRDIRPSQDTIQELVARGILVRSSDPQHAAELGPYKITGFIGRGGMGVVLKAYEQSLDRTVALKILRPDLSQDKTALQRFAREAKAAAAHEAGLIHRDIKSPNILLAGCPILRAAKGGGPTGWHGHAQRGHGSDNDEAHAHVLPTSRQDVSMSPEEGYPTSSEVGEQGRVRRADHGKDGWPTSSEVGERLEDAGAPPRIAPSRGGGRTPPDWSSVTVKIADFGLARMISGQTRMTMPDSVFGTPEYMSPEQARGDDNIDHRTDLYSAGVVLYEMLTGRTPFKADSPSAVVHQILYDDPPDPRTVTTSPAPRLASLAIRLMAKRPEDRFASAGELLAGRPRRGDT